MKAITLIAATLFATQALAEPQIDKEFAVMDTNGDGKVSPAEHAAGAKAMFDTMDGNRDGKVTATEMTAAHKAITGRDAQASDMSAADKIKAVDANRDGSLSPQEHAAGARTMFARMDADRDGMLSKDEMAAGHAAMLRQ